MKKFILLFAALTLQISGFAQNVYATDYVYVPGQGMVEVHSNQTEVPQQVYNDGLFGMPVEDFRAMCADTRGEWDVVSGRHVCYCDNGGEFNYPYGCPVYEEDDDYTPDPEDYQQGEDQTYYPDLDNLSDNSDESEENEEPEEQEYIEPIYYWDIGGHWAEGYIMTLSMLGIFQGYPDGSFRPDAIITRAEMTKISMMASGLMPIPGDEDRNRFFSDLDAWQAPWVNAAYRMDIVEGYSGSYSGIRLFKPNKPVNRAEGVKLVLASFGRRPLDFDKISYTDVHGWMIPWIEDAYRIGLIGEEPNMQFKPAKNLTRAEAAKIIYKMLEYTGDI